MEELKEQLKRITKVVILPIGSLSIIFMLLASFVYHITVVSGTYKDGDWSSPGFGAAVYSSNVSVNPDGTIKMGKTAEEIWEELEKNNSSVSEYLSGPESLARLMNAGVVTQFPDMRKNPDEPIDWEKIDFLKDDMQGIIKFKRAETDGNISTMTYVDPETFQTYIDDYSSSGSEADRKRALRHFTVEAATSSSYAGGQAAPIEAGTTITIPAGLGSSHTYMGWQMITSKSSAQYKLRQKAGMNFDEEGFGRINGRYVIACTTTFGKVGDYIDFYLEDGGIIPGIIGDIKNQNDPGCNKWGHNNGHVIVEFVVDKDTWYDGGKNNPEEVGDPTVLYHTEWRGKKLVKAINGGSYFDNQNFGTDAITGNGKNIDETSNKATMKWPTDGTTITSEYGYREQPTQGASTDHKGIDIGVPEGTKVYACEDGKVIIAMDSETAGNYIVIDHGNGYISKYMHNSVLKVSVGDIVKKGQEIALSGNTGISTGPHLHFQIEYNGKPVDPLTFKYDNNMGGGQGGVGSDTNTIGATKTKYYAKIATWNKTTDTIETDDPKDESSSNEFYYMSTTMINYQELTHKYTMQFNLLWALLVVGDDEDFALELADLAYNSDIEITVYDNYKKNTVEDKWNYIREDKNQVSATVSEDTCNLHQSTEFEDIKSNPYTTTRTVVTETNTVDVGLTKANVWIVDYEKEYKQGEIKTSGPKSHEEKEKSQEFPDKPTSESDEYEHEKITSLITQVSNEARERGESSPNIQKNIKVKTFSRRTDITDTITETEETKDYVAQKPTVIEKTDVNATEPNFITIFNKREYRDNRRNIRNASSWLFKILETNDDTKNNVDLIKYLLNKASDSNYGKNDGNEFDFTIFYPSNLSIVTGSSNYAGEGAQYYQTDYSNIPYGDGSIATSGCGPTCFAMIASQITGKQITPADAVAWCGNRYYVKGIGTAWNYFQRAADHFGLNVKVRQTESIEEAVIALKSGKLVISSQRSGLFTTGGHFIFLYKVDENENIYVKDPNKTNAVKKGYNNRAFTKREINQAAAQYFIFE